MQFEYLGILALVLLVSYGIKVYYKLKFFDSLRQAILSYAVFFIVGVLWDNFAIYRGHWFYPGRGILGIFIGLAPLEDYLFIFAIATCGLSIYKLLQKYR